MDGRTDGFQAKFVAVVGRVVEEEELEAELSTTGLEKCTFFLPLPLPLPPLSSSAAHGQSASLWLDDPQREHPSMPDDRPTSVGLPLPLPLP